MQYGWSEDNDGKIAIKWMTLKPAPESVLQEMSCKCTNRKKCVSDGSCSCLNNGVKCSAVCHSFSCENEVSDDELVCASEDEGNDDFDEDDDDDFHLYSF